MEDYYKILGVKKDSDINEIKQAYLKQLKQYHPDVFKGDASYAQEKTAKLNVIYQTLKDENSRKDYDIQTFGEEKPKTDDNDFDLFSNLFNKLKQNLKPEEKAKYTPTKPKNKTIKKSKINNKKSKINNKKTEINKEKKEKLKLYLMIGIIIAILLSIILVCFFI